MRWTWAILLLAGGRAERRVVVEDFAKAGLWTDTGQVLGLPESIGTSPRLLPFGRIRRGRNRDLTGDLR